VNFHDGTTCDGGFSFRDVLGLLHAGVDRFLQNQPGQFPACGLSFGKVRIVVCQQGLKENMFGGRKFPELDGDLGQHGEKRTIESIRLAFCVERVYVFVRFYGGADEEWRGVR
jgi:hypothetical protein